MPHETTTPEPALNHGGGVEPVKRDRPESVNEAEANTRAAEARTRQAEAERDEAFAKSDAAAAEFARQMTELRAEAKRANDSARGYHDDFVERVHAALERHPGQYAGDVDPVVSHIKALKADAEKARAERDKLTASKVTREALAEALALDIDETAGVDLVKLVAENSKKKRQRVRDLQVANDAADGFSRQAEEFRSMKVVVLKKLLGGEADLSVRGVRDFDLAGAVVALADNRLDVLATAEDFEAKLEEARQTRADALAVVETRTAEVASLKAALEAANVKALQADNLQGHLDRQRVELGKQTEKAEAFRGERDAAHGTIAEERTAHDAVKVELERAVAVLTEQRDQLNALAAQYRTELEAVASEDEIGKVRAALSTAIERYNRAETSLAERVACLGETQEAFQELAAKHVRAQRVHDTGVQQARDRERAANLEREASGKQAAADRLSARDAAADADIAKNQRDVAVQELEAMRRTSEGVKTMYEGAVEARELAEANFEVSEDLLADLRAVYDDMKKSVLHAVRSRWGARRRVVAIVGRTPNVLDYYRRDAE